VHFSYLLKVFSSSRPIFNIPSRLVETIDMLVFMFLTLQRNFVKQDLFSCSTVFALLVRDKTTVVLTVYLHYICIAI
jgi:hypothetical protein